MKKIFISLLILFLFIGCTLESPFSLPNDEKINPKLIGEWVNDNNETVTVLKNDDKTYKISLKDKEKIDDFISFSKTIKGIEIMNIKTENDNETIYLFYGFKVKGNTLTFSEVNDNLGKNDFKSEGELLEYFKKNIKKDDFFINKSELKRK